LQTRNLSLLFGPLAQYPGSDKRRVLSPCVTIGAMQCNFLPSWICSMWLCIELLCHRSPCTCCV